MPKNCECYRACNQMYCMYGVNPDSGQPICTHELGELSLRNVPSAARVGSPQRVRGIT